MPPSGPMTAPEKSEHERHHDGHGQRAPIDLADVTAEAVEHRLVEVRRRMAVLDEESDEEREGQADDREEPRVGGHVAVVPDEPVDRLVDEQPGQHGDRADDRDDHDVDVWMDRLGWRDWLVGFGRAHPSRSPSAASRPSRLLVWPWDALLRRGGIDRQGRCHLDGTDSAWDGCLHPSCVGRVGLCGRVPGQLAREPQRQDGEDGDREQGRSSARRAARCRSRRPRGPPGPAAGRPRPGAPRP